MAIEDLDQHLAALAKRLATDPPSSGSEPAAHLVALLPCEPAVGEVAVACWGAPDDSEWIELVRLDDGERIEDRVALRESLTLLAMVETVEELASFDRIEDVVEQLGLWADTHADADTVLAAAIERGRRALEQLSVLAPGGSTRVARPGLLDQLGGALRALEATWEQLEQAAEIWSDAQLAGAAGGGAGPMLEPVQELWRVLGSVRNGQLREPVGAALHAGREAGTAMASAVAEAMRAKAGAED